MEKKIKKTRRFCDNKNKEKKEKKRHYLDWGFVMAICITWDRELNKLWTNEPIIFYFFVLSQLQERVLGY